MIGLRSVSFRYDGVQVLDEVSVTIEGGATVAVMGPNGAGKTTLLRLIAGLLEPDEGAIDIEANGTTTGAETQGADGTDGAVVGLAPENPDDGLFAGSVREELAFFPRNRGLPVGERVDATIERFGLESLASRTPQTLSQGEKRLVSLASVLAGDPDVVALDEPTSGLDTPGRDRLADRLEDLDRTVLVATHDSDFAWQVADTVVVLHEGRVHRQGSPDSVLGDGEIDFDALGLREPGAVRWAREHGFDRVPDSASRAAEWLSGGDA